MSYTRPLEPLVLLLILHVTFTGKVGETNDG